MALKRHSNRLGQKTRDKTRRIQKPRRPRHFETPRRLKPALPRRVPDFRWADAISEAEWAIYRTAISVLRSTGVPFMLGGGFALATFTGRWRDTKDIDFYIHPIGSGWRLFARRQQRQTAATRYYRRHQQRWVRHSGRSVGHETGRLVGPGHDRSIARDGTSLRADSGAAGSTSSKRGE